MGTKFCGGCKRNVPRSHFHKMTKAKDGLQNQCKDCGAAREKVRNRDMDQRREYLLAKQYGMTQADYERMYAKQEGKCLICGVSKDRLDIDHCHTTSVVRGLLCHRCNTAIGLLGDSPDRMLAAAAYVLQQENVLTFGGE